LSGVKNKGRAEVIKKKKKTAICGRWAGKKNEGSRRGTRRAAVTNLGWGGEKKFNKKYKERNSNPVREGGRYLTG